jgi:hypothetical protein
MRSSRPSASSASGAGPLRTFCLYNVNDQILDLHSAKNFLLGVGIAIVFFVSISKSGGRILAFILV